MQFLKIMLSMIIFILISIWLIIIIAVGVSTGLKNYFNKSSKEEDKK